MLLCQDDTDCPAGAKCDGAPDGGICMFHDKQQEAVKSAVAAVAALSVPHYGRPSTGCDADEKALALDGGGMCAQACSAKADCAAPPAGTTATPVCGSCLGFGGEACEGGGQSCQDAVDCPAHMNCERNPRGSLGDSSICVPGACMLVCTADDHCPEGATCSPPSPDGGVCMFHDKKNASTIILV